MSFSKKNSEHLDLVIAAILDKFAGQIVHNQTLKDYLVATLPEMFPSGRADGAVEHLASVDFASSRTKKGVVGIAFLEGIKDGKKRYWKVPENTDTTVAKADCLDKLSTPLPTKKPKLVFGLVASQKEEG